jgi:hypothetical protein
MADMNAATTITRFATDLVISRTCSYRTQAVTGTVTRTTGERPKEPMQDAGALSMLELR